MFLSFKNVIYLYVVRKEQNFFFTDGDEAKTVMIDVRLRRLLIVIKKKDEEDKTCWAEASGSKYRLVNLIFFFFLYFIF